MRYAQNKKPSESLRLYKNWLTKILTNIIKNIMAIGVYFKIFMFMKEKYKYFIFSLSGFFVFCKQLQGYFLSFNKT